jgi:peroxiredoxin
LHEYQINNKKFEEAGGTLVMVSPQTVENTLATVEQEKLDYYVLSDQGNQVASQLGITYTMPEYIRPVYKSFGMDIPKFNGDDSWVMPLTVVYVIDKTGIIRWAFIETDHTIRAEPEDILKALKDLK